MATNKLSGLVLLLAAAMLLVSTSACIYKFGTSPDSEAVHAAGSKWDYKELGDDWVGVDGNNKSWVCLTGTTQSPINIPKEAVNGDYSLRSSWHYPAIKSNGTNLEVINNGHVIQVEWKDAYDGHVEIVADSNASAVITDILKFSNAAVGTKLVTGKPAQFHFHTSSEHMVFGRDYPLELHIVHFIDPSQMPACTGNGCISVTGVLFEIREGEDNPALSTIIDNLPLREGVINQVPAGHIIDLGAIIPPVGQRAYHQYQGSLTTPPCSEGLLWHVFETPSYMSTAQYRKIMLAVNDKFCENKGNQTDITLDPKFPYDVEHTETNSTETTTPAEHGARHRKLSSSHDHHDHHHDHSRHAHARASLTNLAAAHKLLPRSLEVSVAALPLLRRDPEGRLLRESSPHRVLTETTTEHGSSNMVCVVYAYSRDNRMPQPLHGRIIKYFADDLQHPSSNIYNCSKSVTGTATEEVKGQKRTSYTIKPNGWAKDDYAQGQERCKWKCNAKAACEGFTYKTTGECIVYNIVTGWKRVGASSKVYDSCSIISRPTRHR